MIDVDKLRRTAAKSRAKELRKQRKLRRKKIKKYLHKIKPIIIKNIREGLSYCAICLLYKEDREFKICAIRLFGLKNKNINVRILSLYDGSPWYAKLEWGEYVACDDNKQNK